MDNWTWGLSLIALTIAIHATGATFMVSVLHSFRVRLESLSLGLPHVIAIVIAAFTAMGLLLAVLHGIEAAFWAAAYLWLGALDSPGAAILYSVDSMATRGASRLMLQPHWQMMGALEAADGMLLFCQSQIGPDRSTRRRVRTAPRAIAETAAQAVQERSPLCAFGCAHAAPPGCHP